MKYDVLYFWTMFLEPSIFIIITIKIAVTTIIAITIVIVITITIAITMMNDAAATICIQVGGK